jgi:hypothetical protein
VFDAAVPDIPDRRVYFCISAANPRTDAGLDGASPNDRFAAMGAARDGRMAIGLLTSLLIEASESGTGAGGMAKVNVQTPILA